MQAAYEIEIDGVALGRVDGDESVFVRGPARRSRLARRAPRAGPGVGRRRVGVAVERAARRRGRSPRRRTTGRRAGSPPGRGSRRRAGPPVHFRRAFTLRRRDGATIERARLYVTSAGINQLHSTGRSSATHVLAPGWSTYENRLRYETHDVTALVAPGENVLGAVVADGWWRGHLKWEMLRNVYGDRLGLLAQLEITYADGTTETVATDAEWRTATGPFLSRRPLQRRDLRRAPGRLDGWSSRRVRRRGVESRPRPSSPRWAGSSLAPARRCGGRGAAGPRGDRHAVGAHRARLRPEPRRLGAVHRRRRGGHGRHAAPRRGARTRRARHRPLRNAEATDRYTLRGGGPET